MYRFLLNVFSLPEKGGPGGRSAATSEALPHQDVETGKGKVCYCAFALKFCYFGDLVLSRSL